MHVEVVPIGDALTSGSIPTVSGSVNGRVSWGIRVRYYSTVGDDLEANVRVFREAFDRGRRRKTLLADDRRALLKSDARSDA